MLLRHSEEDPDQSRDEDREHHRRRLHEQRPTGPCNARSAHHLGDSVGRRQPAHDVAMAGTASLPGRKRRRLGNTLLGRRCEPAANPKRRLAPAACRRRRPGISSARRTPQKSANAKRLYLYAQSSVLGHAGARATSVELRFSQGLSRLLSLFSEPFAEQATFTLYVNHRRSVSQFLGRGDISSCRRAFLIAQRDG